MFKPVIPPTTESVPVTVRLPMFAEAIEVLANVLAPVKMLVFARYAMLEVPDNWLIEMPEIVPVTFKLPMLALAILEEEMVVVLKNELLVKVF